MTRRVTDIVDEGEVLGKSGGVLVSVPAGATTEQIDDRVAALLAAGANVTLTYDDVAGTLTIAASGGGAVAVEDEGVEVVASSTRFDFTGAGVTVTDGGAGQANVAIPGQTFDGAIVSNSGTQSIPTGAFTSLLFDTETVDTGAYHNNVTNTDRLVAPATGYYLVTGNALIPIGTGHRYVEIYKNATTRLALSSHPSSTSTGIDTAVSISTVVSLTAGDYITVRVFQDSGSAKSTSLISAQIVRLG